MAVDLLSVKIATEGQIVPALRPGDGVADDRGSADVISLNHVVRHSGVGQIDAHGRIAGNDIARPGVRADP